MIRWRSAVTGALMIGLTTASMTSAQPPRVELSVEGCAADWLAFERLARVLRVELRALGQEVDVVGEHADRTLIVRLAACDDTSVMAIGRGPGGQVERRAELGDVGPVGRTRTLAIVLADLHTLIPADPSPEVVDEMSHETSPEPESEPGPAESSALSLADPAPTGSSEVGPSAQDNPQNSPQNSPQDIPQGSTVATDQGSSLSLRLSLGFDGGLVVADPMYFAGARVGLSVQLDALVAGAMLAFRASRGTDALGTIDLFVFDLGLFAGALVRVGDFSLGAVGEVHPGLAHASAAGVDETVTEGSEDDLVLDLAVVGRARWDLHPVFAIRLDVGLGYMVRGYEARAAERRVIGWTQWWIPMRVELVIRLS